MATTSTSISGGTDKEDAVHSCNGILLRRGEGEIMPFAGTWPDLGIVILSKASQTEKDKCHMILLIGGI